MTNATERTARSGRTLAYPAEESPALARRLARSLGFDDSVSSVVRMADPAAGFATVSMASDVDLVVRIGDLRQPDIRVLRGLHDTRAAVQMVAAVTVESPWVWASTRPFPMPRVRVPRRAYKDLHHAISLQGLDVEIVDDELSPALLAGAEDGSRSVIVDRDEVPERFSHRQGFAEVPDLVFGLISQVPARRPSYFWVVLVPATEAVGTLQGALGVIAEHGVDLDFLQSDATGRGHRFFLGFASDRATVEATTRDLLAIGMTAVVLAAVDGDSGGDSG